MLIQEKTSKKSGKTYEMNEGVGTDGKPVWLIFVTPDPTGTIHRFTTKAEADNWWKHACK